MATIYARETTKGNAWTLQWRVNGRRVRKSLGIVTKKDALLALNAKERELIEGLAESIHVPKFAVYAVDYLKGYKIDCPDSYYRIAQLVNNHLIPHFGTSTIDSIKLREVQQYQIKRSKTVKNSGCTDKPLEYIKSSTINKELRTLHAMLNKAIDDDIITISPIRKIKYLKELDSRAPDAFSEEELILLYDKSPRAHWCKLLASTGMRAAEVRNLLWSNIKDDVIMIESTGQRVRLGEVAEGRTKSGHWRPIPLNTQSREALLAFWRIECGDNTVTALPSKSEPVFPVMHRRSFSRAFKQIIESAGLKGSAHKFRHTFCSLMVAKGVPLYTVQKIAGHSSIKITEKYAHLDEKYFEGVTDNVFDF